MTERDYVETLKWGHRIIGIISGTVIAAGAASQHKRAPNWA